MIISLLELVQLGVIIAVIAYIFMDMIQIDKTQLLKPRFNWNVFKFAALVAAPGVVFHELGHKFVAMFFGYTATFNIWPFGLFLGVFLKLIGSPFIMIAPGAVSIVGVQNGLQNAIISFAGPFVNLILWLGSWLILNNARNLKRKTALFLYLTKHINMILFIFNMIPIPPLDGYQTLNGLFKVFF